MLKLFHGSCLLGACPSLGLKQLILHVWVTAALWSLSCFGIQVLLKSWQSTRTTKKKIIASNYQNCFDGSCFEGGFPFLGFKTIQLFESHWISMKQTKSCPLQLFTPLWQEFVPPWDYVSSNCLRWTHFVLTKESFANFDSCLGVGVCPALGWRLFELFSLNTYNLYLVSKESCKTFDSCLVLVCPALLWGGFGKLVLCCAGERVKDQQQS